MKKITFLLLFLIACAAENYAQCINTTPYPEEPVPAASFGEVQEIATCSYTTEYATISNILIGADYIFTCATEESEDKYITVTDLNDNPIAHGMSPLTVESLGASSIRVHFTEDSSCGGEDNCHITTLQAMLSCAVPTDILVSSITTTGASISWTAGDAETEWQVLVIEEGDDVPGVATTGITVSNTPVYTVNNLTAGGSYHFFIRSNCGSEFSPWRGPFEFNSACLPTDLFNENFETTDVEDVPLCWTRLYVDAADDATIETVDFKTHSGEHSIQISNGESEDSSNLLLISPPLTTLTTGTHRLKFYASGYGDVNLEVGTINSMNDDGIFNMVETISATDEYAEFVVDFTDYTGTDTFIAFRHPSTSTYNPVFLDDIRWEVAPLCPDVTELSVAAVTPASATISWEANGPETQWDIVYGPVTTEDPEGLTPISPAPVTTQGVISGLSANTEYNAWVRSACGGTAGNGAWIGPITFTTACVATGTITENFNSTESGELPNCWTSIVSGEGASNNAYIEVLEDNGISESNAVILYNSDSSEDANIVLVSPNINTLAAGTYRLKFYAYAEGEGSVEIGTMDTPTAGGSFATMETIELTEDYEEYVVDFTGAPVTDTYLAFKHVADSHTGILIDNIRWELAPLCADVTEITASDITPGSVSLTWTAGGSETQWDVVYGSGTVTDPNTLTPISPSPSVTPEVTLSGLADNTRYNIWVRSLCGGTQGNGAWIGPVEIETACLPTGLLNEGLETTEYGDVPDCWTGLIYGDNVSQYAAVRTVDFQAASGENSIELWTDSSEEDDFVMLVSPNLNTIATATHRLKFSATSYDPTTLEIGTMDGNTENSAFTVFEEVEVDDEHAEYVIEFTTYVGADTYLAFRNNSGEYKSIFIDDIKWEPVPACPDVQDIMVSDITINSATVSWSAGSESGWQVVYGGTDVNDPSTLTPGAVLDAPEMDLEGLGVNQSYNVWVRSVCGGTNGNGAWMGPVVFTTLCLPTTVPYVEDFEGADAPSLPSCGSVLNLGEGNEWVTVENPGNGFSSTALVYSFDDSNDANVWYFTQGLTLTAGTEYTISYRYGNNSDDNYVESLKVMYGLSPNDIGMTEDIADHPEINTGAPATNSVAFTPSASGVYYFGFQAYSVADQFDLYLDDIAINATLGTPDVTTKAFTYYPNPVKDVLTISYSDTITNVTIFNLLGQKVLENNMDQNTASVNMAALPGGNYIVKVTAGAMTKTIKIIKE